MKVGIFTFPNSTSYGATLQMYALFHTVNELGHDAEIINYHNAYMKAGKHVAKTGGKRSLREIVRFCARTVLHRRLEKNFRDFEKKNMLLFPEKKIVDKRKLSFANERYDAVICGSDQVWNPCITDTDLSYFLDFCDDKTRRISYAPSFGTKSFSDDFCNLIRKELVKFHAVSVRERQGSELIQKLLGKETQVVLDPTLLVDSKQWESFEENNRICDGEYILLFTVKNSEGLLARCRELAVKTGLTVIVVGGSIIKQIKNRDPYIKYAVDASPSEWLGLVHNARYVVTNSFHGTAFSIIFRKSFYLELSSLTNSRLTNIVSLLGLEDRIVKPGEAIEPSEADYTETERRLPELIHSSLDYLKNALEEGTVNG